ncbi:hypothetical protein A4V15_14110 [Pseudomonas oryzihabitans]|uniref:Uncharacterized protein n=1 Tax=Pseudomonas oryzihabitans TaxID=47885 RepID=A0A178LKH0_9PSED|nr:hypothetical protein A4V15_14110 [Pseudomonas oryzihabitans]
MSKHGLAIAEALYDMAGRSVEVASAVTTLLERERATLIDTLVRNGSLESEAKSAVDEFFLDHKNYLAKACDVLKLRERQLNKARKSAQD